MGADGRHEQWRAALAAHDTARARKAIVAATGVTESMVSHWMTGRHPPPDPDKVFAMERALRLENGELSHHLGYVPVGSSSVPAAISTDPRLSKSARKALLETYRAFVQLADS